MPTLAETQAALIGAVLPGRAGAAQPPALRGRIAPEQALAIHRATVAEALTGALRIAYPTVESLVGEAFFEQAAAAFMAETPPRQANLNAYGDGFPEFLAAYEPACALAYLPDVARLDLAVSRCLHRAPGGGVRLAIDAKVGLETAAGLRLLALRRPADAIRAALDAGDDTALGALDVSDGDYPVVVWPQDGRAFVRRLAPPAGAFLRAVLAGQSADAACAAAIGDGEPAAALSLIQAEVLAAPFVTLVTAPGD